MPLPVVAQYAQLLQQKDPRFLFSLADHHFFTDPQSGTLLHCTGTSAVAFKAEKDGQVYAVRLFLRGEEDIFQRYEQLADYLSQHRFSWVVPFVYLHNEVLIDGHFYPVVKMHWAQGTPLDDFIDQNLGNAQRLSLLQQKLLTLNHEMEAAGMSHGDLKYNNIIIDLDGGEVGVKLIDYDTFYIPSWTGKRSLEIGSPGFQPLKRLTSHFSPVVDRFSIWVILATLEAIKTDARLWTNMEKGSGFNNDHSLFSATDFMKPEASALIQKLKNYNSQALNFYLGKVIAFCKAYDFYTIDKPALFGQPADASTKTDAALPPVPAPEKKDPAAPRLPQVPAPFLAAATATDNAFAERPVVAEERQRPPSIKQDPPVVKPVVPDRILSFTATPVMVEKGGLVTLRWQASCAGPVHLLGIGEVPASGSRAVVMHEPTTYTLKAGEATQHVSVAIKPAAPQVSVIKPKQPAVAEVLADDPPQTPAKTRGSNGKKALWMAGLAAVVLFALAQYVQSGKQPVAQPVTQLAANVQIPTAAFAESNVRSFLDGLYRSYNRRDVQQMASHYAPLVQSYYESKAVSRDSLVSLMKDLFITPAYYRCTPDFSTLKIERNNQECRLMITVSEQLKPDRNSRAEKYSSRIEYVIDGSYKIISEKHTG